MRGRIWRRAHRQQMDEPRQVLRESPDGRLMKPNAKRGVLAHREGQRPTSFAAVSLDQRVWFDDAMRTSDMLPHWNCRLLPPPAPTIRETRP